MERKLKIIVNELFERKEVKTSYERLFGIWYMNSEKDSVWNTIDNDLDEYKFQQMKKERNEYFINKIINNKISSMGISETENKDIKIMIENIYRGYIYGISYERTRGFWSFFEGTKDGICIESDRDWYKNEDLSENELFKIKKERDDCFINKIIYNKILSMSFPCYM